ncbi:hypothetical protein SCHPADRAFT_704469 [Schizopora paradoxa]|uniref:F-box domain-containing protein n=1 Tax=Schizopora paradoxa TaxID=27342 RepID=A0A0H2R2I4_9AGAM|nr:hypothetical protein SCHPADRAFT_704469 [Schizopora paradoxa]
MTFLWRELTIIVLRIAHFERHSYPSCIEFTVFKLVDGTLGCKYHHYHITRMPTYDSGFMCCFKFAGDYEALQCEVSSLRISTWESDQFAVALVNSTRIRWLPIYRLHRLYIVTFYQSSIFPVVIPAPACVCPLYFLEQSNGKQRWTNRPAVLGALGRWATSPTTTIAVANEELHPYAHTPHQRPRQGFESLPLDLFIVIIQLAISLYAEFTPKYDLHALRTVNAVCRYWRWAALSSPSLWAYVSSYLPLSLLQVFLQRSGDTLLHVDLGYGNYFGDAPNPRVGDAKLLRLEDVFLSKLDIILPHSHRVRYLSLSLSATALTSARVKSRLTKFRVPALEGFQFKDNTDFHWAPSKEQAIKTAELSIVSIFQSPQLSKLHLIGISIPSASIQAASLSSLTLMAAYDVIGDAEDYLRDVLNRSTHLVSLALDIWTIRTAFQQDGWVAVEPICLPKLRRLTMQGTCIACSNVYRILSVPSITEICLKVEHSTTESATYFVPREPGGDRLRILVDEYTIKIEFLDSRTLEIRFSFTLRAHFGNGTGISGNDVLLRLLRSRNYPQVTSVDFSSSARFDTLFMPQLLSHVSLLDELSIKFISNKLPGVAEQILQIEDAIGLGMLRSTTSPLRYARKLVYQKVTVVMPQASPYLLGLCAVVRGRGRSGLPPLALEFKECNNVTDGLLRACGLKSSE